MGKASENEASGRSRQVQEKQVLRLCKLITKHCGLFLGVAILYVQGCRAILRQGSV